MDIPAQTQESGDFTSNLANLEAKAEARSLAVMRFHDKMADLNSAVDASKAAGRVGEKV